MRAMASELKVQVAVGATFMPPDDAHLSQRAPWATTWSVPIPNATHPAAVADPGAADEPLPRLEAVEGVRAAMDQLPRDQKTIVHMRIYEEKTFATIAEELDIPLGTALGRMRLAMKRLRSALENEQTGDD